MTVAELEHRVRQATFAFLEEATRLHESVLPIEVLRQGVSVEGRRFAIAVFYRGIFKPKGLVGALSITTAPPKAHVPPPYEDYFGDDGLFRYHYFGDDPGHPDNRAVRACLEHRLPLVYFFGIVPGQYLSLWPVHIVGEDRSTAYFHLDLTGMAVPEVMSTASEETERRYRASVVQHRLHQARFREAVLRAYQTRCAICRLRRAELVDAAHIISDAEGGKPVVSNGLALCKLHHAAFDRHILGVRPDLRIVVQRSVLDDTDGPMLLHGLQGAHNRELTVPRRRDQRPDPIFLERRYECFKAAGQGSRVSECLSTLSHAHKFGRGPWHDPKRARQSVRKALARHKPGTALSERCPRRTATLNAPHHGGVQA